MSMGTSGANSVELLRKAHESVRWSQGRRVMMSRRCHLIRSKLANLTQFTPKSVGKLNVFWLVRPMRTDPDARGARMGKSNRRRPESSPILPESAASKATLTKGQSSVEFAGVSLLFFVLMFAVMDYSWIFFAQMNIQQAVDDGGRFASTGNHLPAKSGGNESRTQSIIDTIQNEISVPNINVASNLSICSANGGCNTSGGSAPAGAPGDTVTLSLTSSLPIWTPWLANLFTGGAYNFTAITTFKNEPFDPSNTN